MDADRVEHLSALVFAPVIVGAALGSWEDSAALGIVAALGTVAVLAALNAYARPRRLPKQEGAYTASTWWAMPLIAALPAIAASLRGGSGRLLLGVMAVLALVWALIGRHAQHLRLRAYEEWLRDEAMR